MTVDEVIRFYQTFSPQSVNRIPELYSADAFFKDPFNEVRGSNAIQRIFEHMYTQVDQPHFIVKEKVGDDRDAVLIWEFHYMVRLFHAKQSLVIRGVSHLKLSEAGLIHFHRDYWDANEELFIKLPGIGFLMRWLRKAFSATPSKRGR